MLARAAARPSLQVVELRHRRLATGGDVDERHVAQEHELGAVVVEVGQLALRTARTKTGW
jgi:hypothetical protein